MRFLTCLYFVPGSGWSAALHVAAGVVGLALLLWVVIRSVVWVRDLRVRAAESERHKARFVAMAASSVDALVILSCVRDAAGEIADFVLTFLNQRAYDLVDLPPSILPGSSLHSLLPAVDRDSLILAYGAVVGTGRPRVEELSINDPRIHASYLRLSAIRFEDGVMLTVTDLTGQRDFERQLCQMAFHDPLTKLPNRALLGDRIQQALERAKRNRSYAAVLVLDIDDFKNVNDSHGHAAGDFVLKTIGSRLRGAVRASDSVFRLGGDEFVLVFSDVSTAEPVPDFAHKVVISLLAPIFWNEHSFSVSASIGVAMYPAAGTTPETLLVQADIEMYRVKRARAHPDRGRQGLHSPRRTSTSSHAETGSHDAR